MRVYRNGGWYTETKRNTGHKCISFMCVLARKRHKMNEKYISFIFYSSSLTLLSNNLSQIHTFVYIIAANAPKRTETNRKRHFVRFIQGNFIVLLHFVSFLSSMQWQVKMLVKIKRPQPQFLTRSALRRLPISIGSAPFAATLQCLPCIFRISLWCAMAFMLITMGNTGANVLSVKPPIMSNVCKSAFQSKCTSMSVDSWDVAKKTCVTKFTENSKSSYYFFLPSSFCFAFDLDFCIVSVQMVRSGGKGGSRAGRGDRGRSRGASHRGSHLNQWSEYDMQSALLTYFE